MGVKERKFRRGLQRRLELISNVQVKKLGSFDWRAIDITFTRNIPANELEIAQMVSTLSNVVSTETLLAQIPFVEDVEAEVKRLEKEKESNPFYDMRLEYNGEEATQEDSKEEEFV
jgi:SPP1 family phage portal protein